MCVVDTGSLSRTSDDGSLPYNPKALEGVMQKGAVNEQKKITRVSSTLTDFPHLPAVF